MEIEIFGFTLSLTLFLILLAVFLYLAYDTWIHTYWWRMGVVHERPWPVLANLNIFSQGMPEMFDKLKEKFGKVYGLYNFQVPILVVTDADMLRHIMVKNFSQFHNRIYFPQNQEVMQSSVASLEDERWREVRNLLTPTFSGSKMKQMSPLVNRSADTLVTNIGIKQKAQGFVECRDVFGSFVMDTIGNCGFGLELDSQANPSDPFVAHAKRAFSEFDANSPLFFLTNMFPTLGRIFGYFNIAPFFPNDVVDFFREVTLKAVALRKNGTVGQDQKWVDFLQLMVDAQKPRRGKIIEETEDENDIHADLDKHHDVQFHSKKLDKDVQLTDNELIGQGIIFFTAGYETTNTLLGFIFYSLSMNPEIQERLIQEVDEMTPSRDSVGYTSIAAMPYLDQVVCETLRIFPPAVVLNRTCNDTFHYNEMKVESGTQVFIPIYTIHHDAEYWPEPEKFNPDRFSKANKDDRHPFAWLPFGAGPHNCIGMRFALMEAKMATVRVLQKYRFETCSQTEIPPKFNTTGFLSPPNGITLRAVPRTDAVVN